MTTTFIEELVTGIFPGTPKIVVGSPNLYLLKVLKYGAAYSGGAPVKADLSKNYLAMDPGETTGMSLWNADTQQLYTFQVKTNEIGPSFANLTAFILSFQPAHLRVENYRIYGWKAEDHKWQELHTPQWIGAIKACAHIHELPMSVCMAQQAKNFWTDEKLEKCGIYPKGLVHGRDALRHLLYFLTFGA